MNTIFSFKSVTRFKYRWQYIPTHSTYFLTVARKRRLYVTPSPAAFPIEAIHHNNNNNNNNNNKPLLRLLLGPWPHAFIENSCYNFSQTKALLNNTRKGERTPNHLQSAQPTGRFKETARWYALKMEKRRSSHYN